jgi:hypothetical protein
MVVPVVAFSQDTLRVQVHGAVVDAGTEMPVYEAMVEWYDEQGQRQALTQTNSEGAYALFVRTTGVVELRVTENGYLPYRMVLPTIGPGESAREFTIRLVPK